MGAWIEPVPPRTAVVTIGRVNLLEVLSLILQYARIPEASAILQPRYIAAQHAGPASLQTAHEDILIITVIVLLHNRFPIGAALGNHELSRSPSPSDKS